MRSPSRHASSATILVNSYPRTGESTRDLSLFELGTADRPSQWFTTLRELRDSNKYTNVFTEDKYHTGVVAVRTEPQVAIGQRAFLLRSPDGAGNILWDCITYIDDETVRQINELGGIKAIVVSHPHYFSTTLHWAEAFRCPVYISAEDGDWLARSGEGYRLWE